jgi:hypothetical protein
MSPPVHHAKDEDGLRLDAIDDNVFTNCEAAGSNAEIVLPGTSGVRETGEERETVRN